MKTETVEYINGDQQVRLIVSEADNLIGARRIRLIGQAIAASKKEGINPDEETLQWSYAPLVSATLEAHGIPWPLSFKEFIHLPERLTDQWGTAVRRLNPHWYAEVETGDDSEKKAMKSTVESADG